MVRRRGKRGNNEGTVYQRTSDEKWVAALTIAPKQRVTRYADTESAARDILRELLKQRDRGTLSTSNAVPLGAYLRQWLVDVKAPQVRAGSLRQMEIRARHVVREIGTIPLGKLTPAHIQRAESHLLSHLSPHTVSFIHGQLKSALRDAVLWELIPRNPCDAVKPPRWEQAEVPFLAADEVASVMAMLHEHPLYAALATIALTGLRSGEARGLRWTDIDWDAPKLSVYQTAHPVPGGGIALGPPKSRAARRSIKLGPELVGILHTHQEQQREQRKRLMRDGGAWEHPPLVFTTTTGRILHADTLLTALREATAAAGLPPVTVHGLRHSFASILANRRVPPHALQKLLGHTRVATTFGIYAHVLQSVEEEAIDSLTTAVFHPEIGDVATRLLHDEG